MLPEERLEMLERLRVSEEKLLRVIDGVTEDLASKSPGSGRWSILQCVEHVVLAEEHMLGLVMTAERSIEPVINSRRERAIVERGANRTRKVEAPDVAIPNGRFLALQDAVRAFLKVRQRTIQFVENCDEDLRTLLTDHPVVGRVNGYETVLLIAVHPLRHAEQIAEIRRGEESALGPI
jgi:uncharacterized damage-inducible protein DinB